MFACRDCGRTAPADPDTGYDADELCPECRAEETPNVEDDPHWFADIDTLLDDDDYLYDRWKENE